MNRNNIDILITTFNEEVNLPHCLQAVMPWAKRVFVVDSCSTDQTQRVTEDAGATFVSHAWEGYGRQKNWAIDNLPWESEWILIVDADEVILPELRDEILAMVNRPSGDVPEAAFNINRYFIFLGKRIRHCGYYPSWNIRLLRRGKARYEERDVHEHILADGPVGWLNGHMEHNDRRGLRTYFEKHNHYSSLEAMEIYKVIRGESKAGVKARFFADKIERRRWIKQVIYPKLPAKWLARFLHAYFLRLGILDGLTGLRFCLFLAAYELMIELKIIEIKRGLTPQTYKPVTQAMSGRNQSTNQ